MTSFSDLHYGWQRQLFELRDVSVSREIQLQEPNENGVWCERILEFTGDFAKTEEEARKLADEHENRNDLRYSGLLGSLNAKAVIPDYMDAMFLGVPENKQAIDADRKSRINQLILRIAATESPNALKLGSIRFFEESEHVDTGIYASFYVPEACFEGIARIASEPDALLQVSMSIRGWYWLGPIGDSQIYIDTQGRQRAELGTVRATRSFPNPPDAESADY